MRDEGGGMKECMEEVYSLLLSYSVFFTIRVVRSLSTLESIAT